MQPKRTRHKFRLKRLSWKLLASKSITTLLHSTLPSITVYLTHIKPESFFPGWRHWWATRPLCRKQSRRQRFFFNHDLFGRTFLEAPWNPGNFSRLNVFWYSRDARIEARLGIQSWSFAEFRNAEFFGGQKRGQHTQPAQLERIGQGGNRFTTRPVFGFVFWKLYIRTNSWYGKEN